ncbi:MAG: hypothetical protein AAGF84_04135 [Planctomycetota bacterium]
MTVRVPLTVAMGNANSVEVLIRTHEQRRSLVAGSCSNRVFHDCLSKQQFRRDFGEPCRVRGNKTAIKIGHPSLAPLNRIQSCKCTEQGDGRVLFGI